MFDGWTTYKYTSASDDGIRVKVNGATIINNWTIHAETLNYGWTRPPRGWQTVVTEYYEAGQGAVAKVWRTP